MVKDRQAIIIAVLFVVLLILLFLSGCTKAEASNQRMRVETHGSYFIYTDLDTGVQYLRGEQGGVCVMVDKDGKPLLANGWRDYD